MEFIVDKKVKDLGLKILGVVITDVDNEEDSADYNLWREEKIKYLIDKYKDYDIKNDAVIEGFYKLHEKVGIARRKNLPASENLIKLLCKKGYLVKINKVVDIYNIISMDSKLCLGAHDIANVSGNISLKLTDGTEKFIPLGSDEIKPVPAGIYSFIDDANDIICYLDIRQVDKTKVTKNTKDIIYFVIGNQENTDIELENTAKEIIAITTKYCGGKGRIIYE